MMDADNFDIFEDRVKSLLARWRKFHDESKSDDRARIAVSGCLSEINDPFTKGLMKHRIPQWHNDNYDAELDKTNVK